MKSGRRWLHLVTVVVAVALCGWWTLGGWAMWSFRGFMLEPSSPEIADNTRFAVALISVAAINIAALIGFLVRPLRWGGLVLAAALLGDIAFSLWASVSRDNIAWLVLGGAPAAVTLVLVLLFRKSTSHSSLGSQAPES
jgi:hypothetical protein